LRIPLTERVEFAVLSVLKQQGAVEFTQALDCVYIDFPNSLTPDSASVMAVLKEYAEPAKGLWRLAKRELEVESQHSQMIHHLAEIGRKLGFDISIGKRESSDPYMGVALGTLATGEPDWSNIPGAGAEGLKQVDCIWHKHGKIECLFEVEHTTQFTEAMIRSQCLDEVNRLFVVPDHRQAYIQRRLGNQLFNELIKRQGWRFMTYERLATLANNPPTAQQTFWDQAVIQLELDLAFSAIEIKPKKTKARKANPTARIFDE
jgi:hypothetical protein